MERVTVTRAWELKQGLIDFILEAEGETAIALEKFAARQGRRDSADRKYRYLLIDSFAIEGKVGEKSPLNLFLETEDSLGHLSTGDRQLLQAWNRSFTGLFEVLQILPDGFEVKNWLTAKQYRIEPNPESDRAQCDRLQPGDIIAARIAPLGEDRWMLFGPFIPKGKLGKPKLAVAIGDFKEHYPHQLYADAPELLQEAWDSVAQYHREFVEYFGGDRVTLPGYQLDRKIAQLTELVMHKKLAKSGVDGTKSIEQLAADSGVDRQSLIEETAKESGTSSQEISQLLETQTENKTILPKVELPGSLKTAEAVTALSDPRWGHHFLADYSKFEHLLEVPQEDSELAAKLVRRYLETPEITVEIWHRLARDYPKALEKLLATVLERPNFSLEADLDGLMQEFDKPLAPELPGTASIPLHLHQLFESALAEVRTTKSKRKSKGKKKTVKGFG
ncbi:hypothetical protein [Oxynema aestuarii]|jgi:hypothetical protein|uniref:Uncharacterized protein n=1 Tax=Oxynema aestuarii AP17 TaxID=2064643 RepID=A0A6H1TT65_9CYAN|nr:hypothetical protein [Oxynema aestuarii]QIZ69406.1 hypothetical protein HCG48_01430 [Oxynema aestuarii AP17]